MYFLYMDQGPTVMAKDFGHDCIVNSQRADFTLEINRNQANKIKKSCKVKYV